MDWNHESYNRVPGLSFISRPENSLGFLYNYNYDQFPEVKQQHQTSISAAGQMLPSTFMGKSNVECINLYGQDPKKKRLSNEQLESLENSFQEEIKLDPDRKMKLSKDLGLHPRQIAVWFQNRRARWKSKQLESLYDTLKQEFDAVSREKQRLQQEVMALRAILKDHIAGKQISAGYTDMSGEETVESTSIPSSGVPNQVSECNDNNLINVEDYSNTMMITTPYNWAALP